MTGKGLLTNGTDVSPLVKAIGQVTPMTAVIVLAGYLVYSMVQSNRSEDRLTPTDLEHVERTLDRHMDQQQRMMEQTLRVLRAICIGVHEDQAQSTCFQGTPAWFEPDRPR